MKFLIIVALLSGGSSSDDLADFTELLIVADRATDPCPTWELGGCVADYYTRGAALAARSPEVYMLLRDSTWRYRTCDRPGGFSISPWSDIIPSEGDE